MIVSGGKLLGIHEVVTDDSLSGNGVEVPLGLSDTWKAIGESLIPSGDNIVLAGDSSGNLSWAEWKTGLFGAYLTDEMTGEPILDENENILLDERTDEFWSTFSGKEFGAQRAVCDKLGRDIVDTYTEKKFADYLAETKQDQLTFGYDPETSAINSINGSPIGGSGGDSKIFIGDTSTTFEEYANAVLDGKLIYLRSSIPLMGDQIGGEVLWEGPRVNYQDWSKMYDTREEAINALRELYTAGLSWEFTAKLSAYSGEAVEVFSMILDPETSLLQPKYIYALLFPEIVMDYSEEDGLTSDFLYPLHINEDTGEVEIYPAGLSPCLIVLHQRGIPVTLGIEAGEVDDFTYVLSLDWIGQGFFGSHGFRLNEIIQNGYHLPFVGEYTMAVEWDGVNNINKLRALTEQPLLSPRYMPITMDTPWSTLDSIFGIESVLRNKPSYEGILLVEPYIPCSPVSMRYVGPSGGGSSFTGDWEFIIFEYGGIYVLFSKNGDEDTFLITELYREWHKDDDESAYAEDYTNKAFFLRHKQYRHLIWSDGETNDVEINIQAVPPALMSFVGRIYCKNENSSPVRLKIADQSYLEIPSGGDYYQVDILSPMTDDLDTFVSIKQVTEFASPHIEVDNLAT